MKTKNIFKISTILSFCLALSLSCSDEFLNVDPNGALSSVVLANKKGTEALLIGAYSMLDGAAENVGPGAQWFSAPSNWVYGGIAGGDAHKGTDEGDQPDMNPIERYESSSVNIAYDTYWSNVYEGVARANSTLKNLAVVTDATPAEKTRIEAEARALRGWYHFNLKRMFNKIPFVDETVADPGKVSNTIDAWPLIQADLQFAYDNLPVTLGEVGRINKFVAGAILGKVLLYQKNFTAARTVLLDVYANGKNPLGVKFALNAKFSDNFNAETKNSPESVFAVQNSVNDGGAAWNGNWGDVLNFPYLSGGSPAGCCGFYQPSFELVNSFRTSGGLPLLDGSYNVGANQLKTDLGVNSEDPFTPDAGPIDPRLDWTVGRRGIPYLDWGLHLGKSWTRKQVYGGPYSPIKNVYYKSQSGTYSDKSSWTEGWTANNTNLIRFADIILMLAETEAEVGTLAQAQTYVNLIRARAAIPAGWVQNGALPAANYVINTYSSAFADKASALKAIHFERKLELGMEGHRFFDLVRWGEAQATLNSYLAYESAILPQLKGANFAAVQDEYYPLPQRQIDLSGSDILVQTEGH